MHGSENVTKKIKWIFKKNGWEDMWIGLIWLRMGKVMDWCECGNGPSGFWKSRKLIS